MTNSQKFETYTLLNLTESESDEDINFTATEALKQLSGNQRKKRLKKKERDSLKLSNSSLYKSPPRVCFYCLKSPCEHDLTIGQFSSNWGEFVRSALLLISVISLPLLAWLTLHLQYKLAEVEASGSELPAKFHESHVRLQMVEKNHSAIWGSLNDLSRDMMQIKIKLSAMETSLNTLEASLMGNPSLTSLPTNVAELQKSVATFGASLQDVQTSLKGTAAEGEKVASSLATNDKAIISIQRQLLVLHGASFLSPALSREGVVSEQSAVSAIRNINDEMAALNAAMSLLNSSVSSKLDASNAAHNKVVEDQFTSLTQRFEQIDRSLGNLPLQNLSSVPSEVGKMKEVLDQFENNLDNLTKSIDVVKGVERKLEGSQVQMASGVSALKQQIQKIDERVSALTTQTPATVAVEKRKRSIGSSSAAKQYPSGLT